MPTPTTTATLPGTPHEANQDRNRVTRFLHGVRYRNLVQVMAQLARDIPERPIRMLDVGCHTGKVYDLLRDRFSVQYTGVDLDEDAIALARLRHQGDERCTFVAGDAAHAVEGILQRDIVVALETCEHIPERDLVRLVEHVCQRIRPRVFIASVPCEIGPSLWLKVIGSRLMGYHRGTAAVGPDAFWSGLYQLDRVPPHGTWHLGFDWRGLRWLLRHHADVRTVAMPAPWLPLWLAPSVMFIAKPRQGKAPGSN